MLLLRADVAAGDGEGFWAGGDLVDGDAVHAVQFCGQLAQFFCWGGGLVVVEDAAKEGAGA
jgi:hypothetical protein